MPKYNYSVREKLEYTAEMVIESELPEDELYPLIDKAERNSENADDVAHWLEKLGIKVIKQPKIDYDSPNSMEVEEWDFSDYKESEEESF